MTSDEMVDGLWKDVRRWTVDDLTGELQACVRDMIDDFFAAHEVDATAAHRIAAEVAGAFRGELGRHFREDLCFRTPASPRRLHECPEWSMS